MICYSVGFVSVDLCTRYVFGLTMVLLCTHFLGDGGNNLRDLIITVGVLKDCLGGRQQMNASLIPLAGSPFFPFSFFPFFFSSSIFFFFFSSSFSPLSF